MELLKPFREAVAAVRRPNREQLLKKLDTERGARDMQAKCLAVQSNAKPGSEAARQVTRQLVVVKAIIRRFETRTMLEELAARRRDARQKAQAELEQSAKRLDEIDAALQPARADHSKLAARMAAAETELTELRAKQARDRIAMIDAARAELDQAVRDGNEQAEATAVEHLKTAEQTGGAAHDFGVLGLRVDSFRRQVGQLEVNISELETERRSLEVAAQAHEVRIAEIDHDDLTASLAVACAKVIAERRKNSRLGGRISSGPSAMPLLFFDPAHVPYAHRVIYPGNLHEGVIETLRENLFPDLDFTAFDADPATLEGYGQAQPAAA